METRYWPFVRGIHLSPVRWIPLTKARNAEFWWFFLSAWNKGLSKQSWSWWFERLSCSLWRHCNVSSLNWHGKFFVEDKDLFIRHGLCHGCRCLHEWPKFIHTPRRYRIRTHRESLGREHTRVLQCTYLSHSKPNIVALSSQNLFHFERQLHPFSAYTIKVHTDLPNIF